MVLYNVRFYNFVFYNFVLYNVRFYNFVFYNFGKSHTNKYQLYNKYQYITIQCLRTLIYNNLSLTALT
nr:MAG TPA: hypothetical protein [Caudoviricetes sp.]